MLAIHHDQFVFADQFARVVQRDNRRQIQATAQNGGVAGGAAHIGHKGGDAGILEIHHIGRRQVVRHQDGVFVHVLDKLQIGAVAGKVLEDTLYNLQHVVLALAQVVFLDGVKLLHQGIALQFQRPFGVATLAVDQVARVARNGHIGQQHDVQRQKCPQLGRGIFGDAAPQQLQLLAGIAHGAIETLLLGGNLAVFQHQMHHVVHALRQQMCPADSDAATDRYTVQHDTHACSPACLLSRAFIPPRRSGC